MPIDDLEVTLRLLAAVAAGAVFGINRDLRGKPTGVRTLGLVALGAALVTVATTTLPEIGHSPDALSRVVQGTIQGIMAGIGFVGAGVVLHRQTDQKVHGLTTATAVWITAALGIACGLGAWQVAATGVVLGICLLVVGRKLERWVERRFGQDG